MNHSDDAVRTGLDRLPMTRLRLSLIEYAANHTLDELLTRALDEVAELVNSPIGFYHFVEQDQKTLSLQQWSTRTLEEFCQAEAQGMHYPVDQAGVWVDCLHEKRPVIHNDYETLPHKKGLPEGHATVVRELVVPVMRDGLVVAILGVGNKAVDYTEADAETVAYLADVTWAIVSRKQAEEELRLERDLARSLLDIAGVIFISLDTAGVVTLINQRGCEILGCGQEDVVGRHWFDTFVPESERNERHAHFRGSMAGENEPRKYYENKVLIAGGGVRTIAWQDKILKDEHGNITGSLSSGEDITDRLKAEARVRTEKEFTETALDAQLDTFFLFEPGTGKAMRWNRAFSITTGYTDAEIAELPAPMSYYSEEDLKRTATFAGKVLEEGSGTIELDLICKDGSTVATEYRVSTVADAHGNPRYLISIGRDISQRRMAEVALRESEERYRSVVDTMRDGLGMAGPDGVIRYVNAAFCRLYGYSREEMIGKNTLELIHPDCHPVFLKFKQALRDDGHFSGESVDLRKDGTTFHTEIKGSRIQLGSEQCMLAVVRDVSERKRAVEEREILQAQLLQAQKMEAVGRLAGGVAHDFNNMLAVIMGRAEMTLIDMREGDPHYDNLEEIRRAAGRSASLTNQLLAFARRQNIVPRVLDFNQTVEWMLKMLRRLIGEDIDLSWSPGPDLWRVRMDPAQVDQILANLCVNARDAITGNGKITIETGNRIFDDTSCADNPELSPGDFVMLAVSDDGCGMDQGTQSHLFEPFFTTKEIGKGTGLGLATVFGIVRQNEGFINVYSEVDEGTTVKVYIPRHLGVPGDVSAVDPVEMPESRGETVLFVEDEPGLLDMGRRMLDRLGYSVLATGSPDEAVELAREHSGEVHLLITDVVMPVTSGKDLSGMIAEIRPNIRILYISGYTDDVIAHHGVLDEDVHFLAKPFSLMALGAKIREVLDEQI